MSACVYILANRWNTTLYVGVTTNLEQRLAQHRNHVYPGFTTKYNVTKLVHFDMYDDVLTAIAAEKRIKNRNREWKSKLVSAKNPNWEDLSAEWC